MESEVKSQAQKVINKKEAGKKKKRLLKLKTLPKRKKENKNEKYKVSNYEKIIRKYNDSRQTCKAIPNKRLTSGRLRPRKTQEGMFLKGLRTQYIRRESLNEANEARKNEDINKIIDIGRGSRSYKKSHKPTAQVDKTLEAGKFSSIFDEKDCENFIDFERCSISPISCEPDVTHESDSQKFSETRARDSARNKREKWEIDFHEEFKSFALQIEKSVEFDIISKLPRKGILENALESLRDLYIDQQREKNNENFMCKENPQQSQFLSGYEFIVQTTQPSAHLLIGNSDDCLQPCKSLIPCKQQFSAIEDWKFQSNTMALQLQSTNSKNSIKHSHFSPASQTGNDKVNSILPDFIASQTSRENSTKEFSFVTPPIQFYRRNMF